MVGSNVLVEGRFGFERGTTCIFAVPVPEVFVFGILERVGQTEISWLVVVYGLYVDGEVVFSIEDAVAARFWAWIMALLQRVGVDGVHVGFEVRFVLEALAALRAFGRVALLDMRCERFVGFEYSWPHGSSG